MHTIINNIYSTSRLIAISFIILLSASCKKFVTVDPPQNSLIDATIFSKEKTATAALLDAYSQMHNLSVTPNYVCVSKASALSADEMNLSGVNATLQQVFTYSLDANQEALNTFWAEAYAGIYRVNAVIAGVMAYGMAIPEENKNQLIGEAKFLRAYFYFMLVNFYGDIPLVLEPDYKKNTTLSRTPVAQVYQQITADLNDATQMLREEYLNGDNTQGFTRVRANKDAAKALLARVSLYLEDWNTAKELATSLIEKTGVYNLESDLDGVFNTQSTEAIMQNDDLGWMMPWAAIVYELTGDPTGDLQFSFGHLSNELLAQFEPGDERRNKWVGTYSNGTTDFPYAKKYYYRGELSQYQTAIRLAEIYLIRAEALIQSGNISGGIADLNVIRARARSAATMEVPDPLPALQLDLSLTDAMLALEKERKLELFTEGHRWFDIKRWNGFYNASISRADEVMPAVAGARSATWREEAKLFPLPQTELNRNVNLEQNRGY